MEAGLRLDADALKRLVDGQAAAARDLEECARRLAGVRAAQWAHTPAQRAAADALYRRLDELSARVAGAGDRLAVLAGLTAAHGRALIAADEDG